MSLKPSAGFPNLHHHVLMQLYTLFCRGLCCNELLDMYNLASKGPWSQPSLQNLLSGTGTSVEECMKLKVLFASCKNI